MTTTIPPISTKTDEEKESALINKFREYRQFKINWAERDIEGWINYREKNYDEIILPVAVKSNIVYHTDEHKDYLSFTKRFVRFMTNAAQRKAAIRINSPLLLGSLATIEYYTTIEVAKYLGLTYEEFYNLPAKDPDKLKKIFDLGEIVHRLINSDVYERIAKMQEEQMKERAEFRKRILKK